MKVQLEAVFKLLESLFELVVAVDKECNILHSSPLFDAETNRLDTKPLKGSNLEDILSDSSYGEFRKAIRALEEMKPGLRTVFAARINPEVQRPMRSMVLLTDEGRKVYIFYGSIVAEMIKVPNWEKDERIKELSCLYAVGEWIKVSASVKDFFTNLPDYLALGMQYPEKAVIYSIYDGEEYGQNPGGKYIKVDLVVNGRNRGEIRIGYAGDSEDFLPEEQKMLNEIGRMLNTALERKTLQNELLLKEEEAGEFNRKIAALQEEIDRKARDVENEKKKLEEVNSYIDRIRGDFNKASERLETIFKAIPDNAAIIDADRKIVMSNREGINEGDKCYKAFFGRERPCDDCRFDYVVNNKTPVSFDTRHGDTYYDVYALPIFGDGHEVVATLEFLRDITKEKLYEQQLQQADKLQTLGQLISGIGHEINNPNQFIRGNVKIVKQALEDIIPICDEYYETHPDLKIARLNYKFFRDNIMILVNDMQTGSERIKSIVEGLKRFARRDEGELIDQVEINNIVLESERLTSKQINKFAKVELDLAGELPTFTGNSQKIEQVLINLMLNAAQAMDGNRRGTIRVKTSFENNCVVVRVADNGKGMSEGTLKSIFDPFFTTRRATGGTGLGLSIVYKIIEKHNGTITVNSKLGEGTEFTISIPVEKKNLAGAESDKESADTGK